MIDALRQAFRRLRHSPGYAAAAITTLALAIGATTAIFSAVYAVLLADMPLRQPERLVVGWGTSERQVMQVIEMSYLDIEDLGAATPGIAQVASVGSSAWTATLDGEGEPVKLAGNGVSGRFFDLVGATPLLGRMIRPEDDRTNSPAVIVISHGLWVRQFGSDPRVIGKRVRLDDQMREIVGVMPATFDYPRGTEFWQPIAPILGDGPSFGSNPNPMRNIGVLFIVGRLNDGVSAAAAAAEWTRAHARMQENQPGPKYDITVTPFLDHHIGPARQAMWILLGAVAVLLLIACANVSGLMLTRVALRHRDDAVRQAIGASRGMIGRNWLAETLVLTAAGAALGLLLCQWFITAILALAPEGIPRLDAVAINTPVALFSLSVMAIVTLLCGMAPIRHASTLSLVETLNDGSRTIAGGRSYRTRSALLVLQIGLSVVLLVAAGLVARSFTLLQQIDLGFSPSDVLIMKVEPRVDTPPTSEWIEGLLERVRTIDRVDAAGAVYLTPMELGSVGQGVWVLAEGQVESPETTFKNPSLNYQVATPEYFSAMGIALKRGRLFNDRDVATSPRVTIVSESTARALFPGQEAVGKRIMSSAFSADRKQQSAWRTIVGVVSDVRYRGLNEVQLDMYDPPAQTRLPVTSLTVRVARGTPPLAIASAITTQARDLDPRVLVSGITTLDAVVGTAMAPWRFSAWVFVLFAALALCLATVGLFSLVSLDVANRRQEFAIRSALGASGPQLIRGVVRAAGVRSIAGIAIGLVVAVAGMRAIRSLLFGVEAIDWATYSVVVLVVAAMVAVAAYLPARAAASVDPLALLRRG